MSDTKKFIISIILPQLAGGIGAIFTTQSVSSWYLLINKPELNPPSWIFGPVWTFLFILMGIALYLVWKQGLEKKGVKLALGLFGFQLVLNTLWSILFFGLQSPGLALIEIVFLWLAILSTIIAFRRVSLKASWLMVPYLLWVSFATYLNYAIYVLN